MGAFTHSEGGEPPSNPWATVAALGIISALMVVILCLAPNLAVGIGAAIMLALTAAEAASRVFTTTGRQSRGSLVPVLLKIALQLLEHYSGVGPGQAPPAGQLPPNPTVLLPDVEE